MFQIEVNVFTDNPGILSDRGTDNIRCKFQNGVVIEICSKPLLGQLYPIALHTRELDFEVISVGTNGFDLDCFSRRLRWRNNRLGRKIKRNPKHVRVFNVEQIFLIEVV